MDTKTKLFVFGLPLPNFWTGFGRAFDLAGSARLRYTQVSQLLDIKALNNDLDVVNNDLVIAESKYDSKEKLALRNQLTIEFDGKTAAETY
ncbi:hypothetical protein [Catalinimonas alkaloidigena]|uniref:hypothetical protein n=1 Tax=Catalinimonas alkaloidigena TaxID=1075417 RepID=UPI000B7F0A87|nr:hypothetical protein [Catalinimonas alkaloidigena]